MEFKDLKGYKTYIVMTASFCYALGGAVAGFLDWNTAVMVILGALGLGGLRHSTEPETIVQSQEETQPRI